MADGFFSVAIVMSSVSLYGHRGWGHYRPTYMFRRVSIDLSRYRIRRHAVGLPVLIRDLKRMPLVGVVRFSDRGALSPVGMPAGCRRRDMLYARYMIKMSRRYDEPSCCEN